MDAEICCLFVKHVIESQWSELLISQHYGTWANGGIHLESSGGVNLVSLYTQYCLSVGTEQVDLLLFHCHFWAAAGFVRVLGAQCMEWVQAVIAAELFFF